MPQYNRDMMHCAQDQCKNIVTEYPKRKRRDCDKSLTLQFEQ